MGLLKHRVGGSKASKAHRGRCTFGNKRGGRCVKTSGHTGNHYGANGSVLINPERNGY